MDIFDEGFFTNRRLLELFLIEVIIYLAIWLYYPFLAQIVSAIAIFITIGVLVVSFISELLEPSKVPSVYFKAMFLGVLSPLVAWGIVMLVGGEAFVTMF